MNPENSSGPPPFPPLRFIDLSFRDGELKAQCSICNDV